MDTSQWPQGIGVLNHAVENTRATSIEKKPRPQKEQALNCPRCSSTNTKFCYYNNYSLSQPRYFCKTCRRYWTEGGSLRSVPVGGGSRKNKRSSSSNINSSSSAAAAKKLITDLSPQNFSPQNPKIHEGHDLNLAYNPSHYNGISDFVNLPFGLDSKNLNTQNPNSSSSVLPAMEFLKTGNLTTGGLSSYMNIPVSDSNSVYSSGFPVTHDHDQYKPSLSFSLDGLENIQNVHHDHQDHHTNSSRLLFPFEELKPVSTNDHQFHEQDRGQGEGNGYWNGMLAGGSW